MFAFLGMCGNYETRKVDRYEMDGCIISTCQVPDSKHLYETAVSHKQYNDGEWIIVEEYDTEEDAQEGHDQWINTMNQDKLPDSLTDISTSDWAIAQDEYSDEWRLNKLKEI